MMQQTPNPTEMNNGHCQYAYAAAIHVGDVRAINDHSRLAEARKANARPSSDLINHRAIATCDAIASASEPKPTNKRPEAIFPTRGVRAVMTRPVKMIAAKASIDLRAPIRSMTIPATRTPTIFGRL